MYTLFLVIILFVSSVHAGGWDDFSNNLATDLTPLLTLFGDQLTKQFLSESTTEIDCFIFSISPIGIVTAIVSVIRVAGCPAWRAFVGRSQEDEAHVEAELCSSTSRNVGELYSNGAVARAFGKSTIAEVVHKEPEDKDFYPGGTAGIHTLPEYISQHGHWSTERPETYKWSDIWSRKRLEKPPAVSLSNLEAGFGSTDVPNFPISPNLSLNIGMVKRPPAFIWSVALSGTVLQSAVMIFAALVTYKWQWEKEGARPKAYACPLLVTGTTLLSLGIFFCAFIVGKSTKKCFYYRDREDKASMHWIQPRQVIGEQAFEPYYHSDSNKPTDRLTEYTTSYKINHRVPILAIWATVEITLIGFVLQFIGLRGIHSAVTVAQLAVVLIMSIARATLRMRRVCAGANLLAEYPDEVAGHEISWLALRLGRQDIQRDIESRASNSPANQPVTWPLSSSRHLWVFCGGSGLLDHTDSKPNAGEKVLAYSTRLAHLTDSPTVSSVRFKCEMVQVRQTARNLTEAIESTVNVMFDRFKIKRTWQNKTSIRWGFKCGTSEVSNSIGQAYQSIENRNQHNAYLQLNRAVDYNSRRNSWEFKDRKQVEGLIGLWLWSLISDPRVETINRQTNLRTSTAGDVQVRRVVCTSQTATESDLRKLPGSENWVFSHDMLCGRLSEIGHAGTVWKKLCHEQGQVSYRPFTAQNLGSKSTRLFGWHTVKIPRAQEPEELAVWSISSKSSLMSLCAQGVFGSFLTGILDVLDDDLRQDLVSCPSKTLPETQLRSALVDVFVRSELGSTEEALLCIVPPLLV